MTLCSATSCKFDVCQHFRCYRKLIGLQCASCLCAAAYTMDANEAQEEYEEVQSELRKKEEEVG